GAAEAGPEGAVVSTICRHVTVTRSPGLMPARKDTVADSSLIVRSPFLMSLALGDFKGGTSPSRRVTLGAAVSMVTTSAWRGSGGPAGTDEATAAVVGAAEGAGGGGALPPPQAARGRSSRVRDRGVMASSSGPPPRTPAWAPFLRY